MNLYVLFAICIFEYMISVVELFYPECLFNTTPSFWHSFFFFLFPCKKKFFLALYTYEYILDQLIKFHKTSDKQYFLDSYWDCIEFICLLFVDKWHFNNKYFKSYNLVSLVIYLGLFNISWFIFRSNILYLTGKQANSIT